MGYNSEYSESIEKWNELRSTIREIRDHLRDDLPVLKGELNDLQRDLNIRDHSSTVFKTFKNVEDILNIVQDLRARVAEIEKRLPPPADK